MYCGYITLVTPPKCEATDVSEKVSWSPFEKFTLGFFRMGTEIGRTSLASEPTLYPTKKQTKKKTKTSLRLITPY